MNGDSKHRILRELIKKQRNRCYLCDCLIVVFRGLKDQQISHSATIDHMRSIKHGGGWEIENLAACCYACNQIKGSRSIAKDKKTEKKQRKDHNRNIRKFAEFLTKIHIMTPLRGGW